MSTRFFPLHVEKKDEQHLYIRWNDHNESNYNVVELRRSCVCAHCVDEITREQILKPEDVSTTVAPTKVRSLGRYALTIDWTDGHMSSIYSWEKLREYAELST